MLRIDGYQDLVEWLSITFWFHENYMIKYKIFETVYYSWKLLTTISAYMTLASNSLVFIDLYLTIRNPFYPRKKRFHRYMIILGSMTLFFSSLLLFSISKEGTDLFLYSK